MLMIMVGMVGVVVEIVAEAATMVIMSVIGVKVEVVVILLW